MTRARPQIAPYAALIAALTAAQTLSTPAAAQSALQQESQEISSAPPAPDGPTYAPGDIVATVDAKEIRLDEVVVVFAGLPENVQALPDATLWEGIVTQLIDETVITNAALEAGLENRRDVVLAINAQRRAILANAYLDGLIQSKLTEESIEAEYRKRFVDIEPVKQVRASHILLKEQETAQGVLTEIKGGKDFAEAAKEHSTGPTGPNGGDLGYFEQEQMVPEFANAAFAMQVGEVSEPVQSDFGWHLIKLVDIRDRPAPGFESARATIMEEMTVQLAQETVAELRADAKVERLVEEAPNGALRNVAMIAPPSVAPAEMEPSEEESAETETAPTEESEPEAPAPITERAPENAPAPTPAPATQ